MGWFTDLFKSKTKSVDTSQPMPMPQYTTDSVAPWGEKLARQMGGAFFGVPGQSSGLVGWGALVGSFQKRKDSCVEAQGNTTRG